MILTSAITCLALNVYFESRNQPVRGQIAVAAVTLNRTGGDEKKICQVVTQPYQFSWTINRLHKDGDRYFLPEKYAPKNIAAWIQSWQVAEKAIASYPSGIVQGATFYHTIWSNPSWDDHMTEVARIGDHVFYVPQRKSAMTLGETNWNHTELSQTPTTKALVTEDVETNNSGNLGPQIDSGDRDSVLVALIISLIFVSLFISFVC